MGCSVTNQTLQAYLFPFIAFVPSGPEKRIYKESRFFDSKCLKMTSCKSAAFLEVVNSITPKNLLTDFLSKVSTKRTKIDICNRSASSVDSSANIMRLPAAKSITAFKNCSALKVEIYVEFLGALFIYWKMSSSPRLARYSIVFSKLFFTVHFFLARK